MDSLKDLLAQKDLDEPTEVSALRDYYRQQFMSLPSIKVTANNIVLIVPNSKIASEIRYRRLEIERRCLFTKRFIVRVG